MKRDPANSPLCFETDAEFRTDTLRRIKRGMADVATGRVYTPDEARRYLAARMKQWRNHGR